MRLDSIFTLQSHCDRKRPSGSPLHIMIQDLLMSLCAFHPYFLPFRLRLFFFFFKCLPSGLSLLANSPVGAQLRLSVIFSPTVSFLVSPCGWKSFQASLPPDLLSTNGEMYSPGVYRAFEYSRIRAQIRHSLKS